MLIDPKFADPNTGMDDALGFIARGRSSIRVSQGLYVIGHWNFEMLLADERSWEKYPDLGYEHNAYGVCDSPDQLMEVMGEVLKDPSREFVVSFVELRKADESPEGGWRWHKWGPYTGKQDPQCEYLYDEPVIERVYTYHVYERK